MSAEKSIDERFSKIEERLDTIEKIIFSQNKANEKKIIEKDDFSGLNGGIRLLINNDFFSKSKTLKEIINELQRESYHYGKGAIANALSINFTKKQKILTRFKEDKIYKYVIRK